MSQTSNKHSRPKYFQPHKSTYFGFALLVVAVLASALFIFDNSRPADYIVETNAFFAPFEFYEGREIKGVDVEIINRVADYLGKTIRIKNVEFDVIIDNVEAGRIADAGAAGLTITKARLEKVDFSLPYYTSSQYILYSKSNPPALRNGHVTWQSLAGHTLGSQTGSTGYLFTADEIENGSLHHTGTELKGLDSHQIAADGIAAHVVDYVVIDELAANFITDKNPDLAAAPLYYQGTTPADDYPVEESYAIAVNKNRPELLAAFNHVLTQMLIENDRGLTEIDQLVIKYMKLEEI